MTSATLEGGRGGAVNQILTFADREEEGQSKSDILDEGKMKKMAQIMK